MLSMRPKSKMGRMAVGPADQMKLLLVGFRPSPCPSSPKPPVMAMRGKRSAVATPMRAFSAARRRSASRMSGRRRKRSTGTPVTSVSGGAGRSRRGFQFVVEGGGRLAEQDRESSLQVADVFFEGCDGGAFGGDLAAGERHIQFVGHAAVEALLNDIEGLLGDDDILFGDGEAELGGSHVDVDAGHIGNKGESTSFRTSAAAWLSACAASISRRNCPNRSISQPASKPTTWVISLSPVVLVADSAGGDTALSWSWSPCHALRHRLPPYRATGHP